MKFKLFNIIAFSVISFSCKSKVTEELSTQNPDIYKEIYLDQENTNNIKTEAEPQEFKEFALNEVINTNVSVIEDWKTTTVTLGEVTQDIVYKKFSVNKFDRRTPDQDVFFAELTLTVVTNRELDDKDPKKLCISFEIDSDLSFAHTPIENSKDYVPYKFVPSLHRNTPDEYSVYGCIPKNNGSKLIKIYNGKTNSESSAHFISELSQYKNILTYMPLSDGNVYPISLNIEGFKLPSH